MPFRASLACSLLLVGACGLGEGCGGTVAPVIGGDGGGSGSSSGGGSSSSGSGGGSDGGMTVDTGAPGDSSPQKDVNIGPCQPDGVPCNFAAQCCTAVCGGGVCGGIGPTCTADESPCQSSSQCCSGLCSGNICVEPTTGCAVSSNANKCDICLAMSCCPQLSACESNTTCAETQNCFDACYMGPGTGASCAQKCGMQFPSTQGGLLEQCAANSCLAACN